MDSNAKLLKKVGLVIVATFILILDLVYARTVPIRFITAFSSELIVLATYLMMSRFSYVRRNRPNGAKNPNNKQQLVGIGLVTIPLITAAVWWIVVIDAGTMYLLRHHGIATTATIDSYGRSIPGPRAQSASVRLNIQYDGHHGVLLQSASDSSNLDSVYGQFLDAAQNNQLVSVHYLKGIPFIVLSDSQLGLR